MNNLDKLSVKGNQPSPEAIRAMIRFMMKTSMPRIIAEELAKRKEEDERGRKHS